MNCISKIHGERVNLEGETVKNLRSAPLTEDLHQSLCGPSVHHGGGGGTSLAGGRPAFALCCVT